MCLLQCAVSSMLVLVEAMVMPVRARLMIVGRAIAMVMAIVIIVRMRVGAVPAVFMAVVIVPVRSAAADSHRRRNDRYPRSGGSVAVARWNHLVASASLEIALLRGHELRVQSGLANELAMCARLHDLAVVQHDHPIRSDDAGQSMGDD